MVLVGEGKENIGILRVLQQVPLISEYLGSGMKNLLLALLALAPAISGLHFGYGGYVFESLEHM